MVQEMMYKIGTMVPGLLYIADFCMMQANYLTLSSEQSDQEVAQQVVNEVVVIVAAAVVYQQTFEVF
jgi:hypothetical protein